MILENAFIKISKYLKEYDYSFSSMSNSPIKNASNEHISTIDMYCNDIIVNNIKNIPYNIIGYISEEINNIQFIKSVGKKNYILAFDPLDGSSNMESNINTGSIYCIYEYVNNRLGRIIRAGYCLYGPSTILVDAYDNKVKMYRLDINNNFIFQKNLNFNNKLKSKIYSINSSNIYDKEINFLIQNYKKNNYSQRWVGTMVADCHRILINDGIFIYSGSTKFPNGKIRLYYEALPFAFIFSLAGGYGLNGGFKNILKNYNLYNTSNIHSRIPIILCSTYEYNNLTNLLELLENE